ncbi:MAG: UvrD-helicase domain-containing protein [Bacteroides sp.]|nr:UvrD-helicase domain-containing protein [Bacteroides sp.]
MLQLQRASAGSGKTFMLAKKFIWYLITIKDTGGDFRLRTEPEISDGLSRILAITFTNKATAQMKQRIIDKIAAIADTVGHPITPKILKDTDYLDEFAIKLKVAPEEIGKACKIALKIILNQYSDFNVSTIDSFFQTVLRTFAYESNLNDSYQLEIDSDYIATVAIDAILEEVNTIQSSSSFWLNILMNDSSEGKGSVWNVFQKSTSSETTIYSKLRDSLNRMENEEFKEKRNKLDEYLLTDKGPNRLIDAYLHIRSDIEKELRDSFDTMKNAAIDVRNMLKSYGLDAKEHCIRHFDSHLDKISKYKFNIEEKRWFKINLPEGKSILKKGVSCNDEPLLTQKVREMYAAFKDWSAMFESDKIKLWNIYSVTLPYLGLLLDARDKITTFLDTNNLIQLGETNSMLNRIIGESDTPFVYERLGTNINHYLIDEFQDTSKMQWDNLKKLLKESDSRGEDNLIIGDAKQSIYRFRNAEPSLITKTVPEEFAGSVRISGMSKEDNTNWRSCRRIVEFNNFFFHALAAQMIVLQEEVYKDTDGNACEKRIDFSNLYNNVVQYPKKQEDEGYVEIRFFDKPMSESNKDNEEKAALKELGPLISSLVARGYRQQDIALLINTKRLGNEVVDAIIEYNSQLSPGIPKIEFISENSLMISSSEAVGIIISTLQKISEGTMSRSETAINPKESDKEDKKVNWRTIKNDFSFFALRHPELAPAAQIAEFLKEGQPIDVIREMLRGMQAVVLPSLVESIIENFVPEALRKSQAVFIASFQDLVLDYCEGRAPDIASFLDWWKSRGMYLSISSPEDTDAIRIMTIHKSKGLEFKCVILPFEKDDMIPSQNKKEWRWVKPSSVFAGYDLPEWLPIETTKDLLNTEYADIYRSYCDMYMMDRLNTLYVAFTRAQCELYIFTKYTDKNSKRASYTSSAWFLKELCTNMENYFPDNLTNIIPVELMQTDNKSIITFGTKTDPEEENKKAIDRNTDISLQEKKIIEEYGVNSQPSIIHCLDTDTSLEIEDLQEEITIAAIMKRELEESATVSPEAADNDPRSEGNLLHAIMEKIRTHSDLHMSVLSMKMRGLISSQQAVEWENMLAEAISADDVKAWFDGKWYIMNERNILIKDKNIKRPDRIMISPDGKEAIIVDYKFGDTPEDEDNLTLRYYFKQVSYYSYLLRRSTGIRNVSSYIWYVRTGKIFKAN